MSLRFRKHDNSVPSPKLFFLFGRGREDKTIRTTKELNKIIVDSAPPTPSFTSLYMLLKKGSQQCCLLLIQASNLPLTSCDPHAGDYCWIINKQPGQNDLGFVSIQPAFCGTRHPGVRRLVFGPWASWRYRRMRWEWGSLPFKGGDSFFHVSLLSLSSLSSFLHSFCLSLFPPHAVSSLPLSCWSPLSSFLLKQVYYIARPDLESGSFCFYLLSASFINLCHQP